MQHSIPDQAQNVVKMFCPNCKSLLTLSKNKGVAFCRRCNYKSNYEVQKTHTVPQMPVHPDFPLFPYPEIRGGQREFMADIKTAAQDGKVLIAQAPTGIGKTAATLSTLLEVALATDKIIFFLTSKHSQHTIVVDTLKKIATMSKKHLKVQDIIAKQSMCPDAPPGMPGYAFLEFCKMRNKSRTCPHNENPVEGAGSWMFSRIMHVHEMQRACMNAQVCPHKAAQEVIASANIVVCDYNYIFDNIAGPLLERKGKTLKDVILVVDEAHNLPDRIRANMSMELTAYDMAGALTETTGKGIRGHGYTRALGKALNGWVEKLQDNKEEYFDKKTLENELEKAFSETLGEKDTFAAYIKWLRELGESALKGGAERSYALELGDFLDKWVSLEKGVARILSRGLAGSWALRIAFLEVETAAGPILSEVGAAVMMSGTLCPPGMYADLLGVPKEKRMERIYESPFPKENRKVLGLGGITTQFTKRDDAMYDNYATTLAAIAGAVDGNVAAFFPSYKFLNDVGSKISDKLTGTELIIEAKSMTKRDRENVVERLRNGSRSCLMLAVQGGGLSEGIDYDGNILSAIAVVGLPLAPPNLEVNALIKHFKSEFGEENGYFYGYLAPAINKVVQSAGRLIRSEKDRGVVILMDERFSQARYTTVLPPEMQPKLFGSPEELIAEVKMFFE